MVAFDNTILSLLLFPDADLQEGPAGQNVEHARARVLGLIESLEASREQVAIPSPALAEVLVTEGADVQDILTTLRGSAFIRIESFDERAAVELAMRLRDARKAGDQRESQPITKNATNSIARSWRLHWLAVPASCIPMTLQWRSSPRAADSQ